MIKITDTETIQADQNGMTIKQGERVIFLSWSVIDKIAEESEPHYFGQVVNELAIMNGQKRIN